MSLLATEAIPDPLDFLAEAEIEIEGRMPWSSNATFLVTMRADGAEQRAIYKPVRGERPLWDFPDGTLAGRERGAYLISAALGWNIVPYTIIRDGPAGRGMLQLWVDQPGDDPDDETVGGPDLVDLLPAGRIPPGYLPVLRAYDYAGDEVNYYFQRPRLTGDGHGQAPMLWTAAALLR